MNDWPYGGFPGTARNPDSLALEVVDREALDAALAGPADPEGTVIGLLALGRTGEAADLVAEARLADPSSFALRMLDGEVLRATGDCDRAADRLRLLAAEAAGTAQEDQALQVLGYVHFACGRYAAAVRAFNGALELRVAAGVGPALIYASTTAKRRAMDLAELGP
ncbi:MAG: hypothetical protein ACHP7K_09890 [Actinomycetales bacterium]